jgi:hypothetical protein
MCEKCVEFDMKIERYRSILRSRPRSTELRNSSAFRPDSDAQDGRQ